ncbi:T-cell receptor alpha chain V region CTL-F3 [Nibea albiflora]|nr:T-cell receptor alpha chain V region CTL-F3 [Nibea albiflora]
MNVKKQTTLFLFLFVNSILVKLIECKGEDRVIQPAGDVNATEGDTVTLNCTFQTSDNSPYLFWYKQEVNDIPIYILRRDTFKNEDNAAEFPKERFNATIQDKSVPLKIQKLQLSDSAVYYCAVRPTVTGNTKTLYKNLWSKDNRILHNIH